MSVLTLIFVVVGLLDPGYMSVLPLYALVDAVLFAAAAIGIWRLSRAWSVVALVLYLAEIVWRYQHGMHVNVVVTLLIVFAFINGVRGTFEYQRFSKIGEPS